MMPFTQILVPTDYSEPADAALRLASQMARAARGRLVVAHMLPLPVYTMTEYAVWPIDGKWIAEEKDRLQMHVRKVLEAEGEVPPFEVDVTMDTPFLRVVQLAAERRVDLIVMGTHGRSGLKHLVLGSVAEKVVRLAPCPVLTVHGSVPVQADAAVPAETQPARATRPGDVAELMYRRPVTIEADAMLEDARRLMAEHRIRHLPVVERGKIVGILSDADLGPHVGQLPRTKVNGAMTANPTCVAPDVDAAVAARMMLEHRVRALPVVDGETVVGIISASDILEEYLRAARA